MHDGRHTRRHSKKIRRTCQRTPKVSGIFTGIVCRGVWSRPDISWRDRTWRTERRLAKHIGHCQNFGDFRFRIDQGPLGSERSVDYAQLRDAYSRVKKACWNDWRSEAASQAILDLVALSLRFLATECEQVGLESLVPDKKYISFLRNNTVARPANQDFFMADLRSVTHYWRSWSSGNSDTDEFERMLYTVAIAPCLAMELFDRNNQERPCYVF